ncbi:MAG: glycosyltransferase family 39 protein [Lentisphaeria bacterium]|nr:glycosyltransferase family 39 protein [Lentisphaeria bacterium]
MEEINKKTVLDSSFRAEFFPKDYLILAGILLLGAVLCLLQRFMESQMGRDSAYYLTLVSHWQSGGFQGVVDFIGIFWFPPLHLFLIVFLANAGLSPESAAIFIGISCAILMPLISFFIARELFHDRRISLVAALLTAINPSIIEMSVQTQRDVPYLFAAGWCIYFIVVAIHRNKWFWWCAAGGCFGVSMLIRYETAEFLPLLGIYFIVALFKKQQKWYSLIRNLVLFAICGITSMIILLYSSGTLHYMAGAYYRYFTMQTQYLLGLYHGGQQK